MKREILMSAMVAGACAALLVVGQSRAASENPKAGGASAEHRSETGTANQNAQGMPGAATGGQRAGERADQNVQRRDEHKAKVEAKKQARKEKHDQKVEQRKQRQQERMQQKHQEQSDQ